MFLRSKQERLRILRLELSGKRSGGGPQRRFMDVFREHEAIVGARGEEVEERLGWRQMIGCATCEGNIQKTSTTLFFSNRINIKKKSPLFIH